MIKLLFAFIAWFAHQVLKVHGQQVNNEQLNVLFLIIDDLRTDVGSYRSNEGETFSKSLTPNLDRLATNSVQFQRAYAQIALCGPSRASFLTGRKPQSLDYYVQNLDDVEDGDIIDKRLPLGLKTLPKFFFDKGYATRGAGKVFHRPKTLKNEFEKSFLTRTDKCNGGLVRCTVEGPDPDELNPKEDMPDTDMLEWGLKELEKLAKSDKRWFMSLGVRKPHMPFRVMRKHEDFVERIYPDGVPRAKTPARLEPMAPSNYYCHVMDNYMRLYEGGFSTQLSDPFQSASDDMSSFLRGGYYSAVNLADEVVGQVLKKIEDLEMMDHTLIVVTSDNGYQLGEHGNWCKNTNSELNTRVPLWFRHPRGKKNVRVSEIVSLIDLYPTIVNLAGLHLDKNLEHRLEGQSFANLVLPVGNLRRRVDVLPRMAFSVSGRCLASHGLLLKCYKRSDLNVVGFSVREDRWRYTEWRKWDDSYINSTSKFLESTVVDRELYDHEGDDGTNPDESENTNFANSKRHSLIVETFARILEAEFGCEGPSCFSDINIVNIFPSKTQETKVPSSSQSTLSPTNFPSFSSTLSPPTSKGNGKEETDGNDCTGSQNFVCKSEYTFPKCQKKCHYGVNDCECWLGYKKVKENCIICSTFECPLNSSRKRKNCIKSINDCECDYGFKPNKKQQTCDACRTFSCPKNSEPKNKECINDFGDCECKQGYKKQKNECILCSTYQCPAHSEPKHSAKCINKRSNCKCLQGFKEDAKGDCTLLCSFFSCPRNSQPRAEKECIKDFDDCECHPGFEKKNGKCINCNTFTCPKRSCVKDLSKCVTSFNDCVCQHGFKAREEDCIECGDCTSSNRVNPLEYITRECWHPECPNPEYNPPYPTLP